MEDRGSIIKQVIDSYGIKHSYVWKRLGISKDTFIRLKKTPNVPDADVERIGHIIRHDFRKEIPGLKITVFPEEQSPSLAADAEAPYMSNSLFQRTVIKMLELIISLLQQQRK